MRARVLNVLGWSVAVASFMMLMSVGFVYLASWRILGRQHDLPLAPDAKAAVLPDTVEGRRLAVLVGCLEGCHGKRGEGLVLEEEGIFRLGAPTLHNVLREYSDAELVRLLRFGVKRDGRTALLMPSGTFFPLSDADLGSISAALRALPPEPGTGQARLRDLSMIARLAIVLGKFPTSVAEVDRTMPRWGELPRSTSFERGRYLASIVCSECHGLDFKGEEFEGSPSLQIVAAYDLGQFKHLMRTGQPISGRDLGLMSQVARAAFVHFRDDEIVDIYTFLRTHFSSER